MGKRARSVQAFGHESGAGITRARLATTANGWHARPRATTRRPAGFACQLSHAGGKGKHLQYMSLDKFSTALDKVEERRVSHVAEIVRLALYLASSVFVNSWNVSLGIRWCWIKKLKMFFKLLVDCTSSDIVKLIWINYFIAVSCCNYWATWIEMMSEGYICVQPVTFWWTIICSHHWATWTEMVRNLGYETFSHWSEKPLVASRVFHHKIKRAQCLHLH